MKKKKKAASKRSKIGPVEAYLERLEIVKFTRDRLKPSAQGWIEMRHVYHAYKTWRKKMRLPVSKLSLDGFGKLFPKSFKRETRYSVDLGHNCRHLIGVKFQ